MRLGRLVVGGRLDRYVGALFIASYATALLLVVGLAVIIDLTSHLSYFEEWDDGTSPGQLAVVRYYLMSMPFIFLQVAPYVTLVAGMFTLSRLVRHNEVTAALAAGISAHRLLAPVMLGAVIAGFGMFSLREYATRTLGAPREALRDRLSNQRYDPVFESVWVRDKSGNVARLSEFRPYSPAGAPEVLGLEAQLKLAGAWKKIQADRAVWTERDGAAGWSLENGAIEEVERQATRRELAWLEGVEFNPDDALCAVKGRERPLELSFSELRSLLERDPDNGAFQTLLQYHLTFPLANVVLLLIALPSMLGRERGKALEGVMIGLLLCVLYFSTEFICRELGVEGALSPLLASWLPVLIFGSVGLALFDSMRT